MTHPVPTQLQQNQPVTQFELGTQRNFVYAILNWSTPRRAVLIDPQHDIQTPLDELARWNFELTAVLLTHSHSDHTAGVPALLERFPKLPIYVHTAETKRLKKLHTHALELHPLSGGEKIPLGALELEAIHTPGHSAGECCYLLRGETNYLFTGDMLFIGDCGRTDLETGSTEEMFESLQKLRKLAGELGDAIILPGHHYAPACTSTLQHEIANSPVFQCRSPQDLARL